MLIALIDSYARSKDRGGVDGDRKIEKIEMMTRLNQGNAGSSHDRLQRQKMKKKKKKENNNMNKSKKKKTRWPRHINDFKVKIT